MTQVEPAQPRFSVTQTSGAVTVTIPSRKNWLILLFIIVWLVGWTVAGANAIPQAMKPGAGQLFMVVWCTGWVFGELYAISVVLWQLAGREELVVSSSGLAHRVVLANFGRTRQFAAASVKHLRASPQVTSTWMDQRSWMPPLFGSGHGTLAFDYGAKTYRLGSGLDEAEGRLIVGEVRKYSPRMVDDP